MRPFLCLILILADWDWHDRASYESQARRVGMIGLHVYPSLAGLV